MASYQKSMHKYISVYRSSYSDVLLKYFSNVDIGNTVLQLKHYYVPNRAYNHTKYKRIDIFPYKCD